MTMLTIERTLIFRGEDGDLTRYEILRTDDSPSNSIDSIIVYRQEESGEGKVWVNTEDNISLEHLGFPKRGTFPIMQQHGMRASRDISSAIEECAKHWEKTYA